MRPPTSQDLHSPDFSMAKFYENVEAITTENETEREGLTTGVETDGVDLGRTVPEMAIIESDSEINESNKNMKKELSDAIDIGKRLSYEINLEKIDSLAPDDLSDPGSSGNSST